MKQIPPACGLFEGIVRTIMALHKNTKAMACLPDGDTTVLQEFGKAIYEHIFVYNLLRLRPSNVDISNKR